MEDSDRERFLNDAAGRQPHDYVTLTVRDLISYWDAKRRGYWIVAQIERDLDAYGLKTEPHFNEGWIDNTVRLVPVSPAGSVSESDDHVAEVVDASDVAAPEVSLQVSSLESANTGVECLAPDDSLERAQSLMMRNDFSQLGVMSGERDLRGAVSWESIAQAHIRSRDTVLRDAIVPAVVVRADDDLLARIPQVIEAGYVFVQARDRRITGIVTTADLSDQFVILATPFFVLAEIERRLRRHIDSHFDSDELKKVIDPSDDRPVESADDLTIGGYLRLVKDPQRWSRFGWAIDRKVFVKALDEVRMIRNEILHFSPDPLDEDSLKALQNFRKWLRHLDPLP